MRLAILVLSALFVLGAAMFAYERLGMWREGKRRAERQQRRLEERRLWDERMRGDD